jgi:hypothetical protein
MTEKAAKSLAIAVGGDAVYPIPGSRTWGVPLKRADGRFVAIEDDAGWLYCDRNGYGAYQETGDDGAVVDTRDSSKWSITDSWARALAGLLAAKLTRGAATSGSFSVSGRTGDSSSSASIGPTYTSPQIIMSGTRRAASPSRNTSTGPLTGTVRDQRTRPSRTPGRDGHARLGRAVAATVRRLAGG